MAPPYPLTISARKAITATVVASVFIGIAIGSYFPGLAGPFLFDDLTNILMVPGIQISRLDLESLVGAWKARDYDTFIGRPLAMLSFALNHYFSELRPYAYKATNLAIHLVNALLIFWLTRALLTRHLADRTSSENMQARVLWLSLGISTLWSLHPLHISSVLYIVQRMTILSALFTLAALIGYVKGREQILQGRRLGFITIAASYGIGGVLSVLCKENGALLPFFAAVIELAFYRFRTTPELSRSFRRFWLLIVVLPVLAGIAYLLVDYQRLIGPTAYQHRDFTLGERLLTESRAIWFYLRLILFPDIKQMGIYHDDFVISHGILTPPATLIAVVGILGLVMAALTSLRRLPIVFFALAWFLAGHLMESTILPLELVFEHRNYLPMYGILFGMAYMATYPYPRLNKSREIGILFVAGLMLVLTAMTYFRASQWRDELTIYTTDVTNHPNSPRAHTILAALLHNNKYYDQAERHLTIATNLSPNHSEYLIRLVQHLYLAKKPIPPAVLRDLEYRVANGKVSGVTLWAFETLLRASRNDRKYNDIFLRLYETILLRPDVDLRPVYYESGFHVLADYQRHAKRYPEAIRNYRKAIRYKPQQTRYYLEIADLQLRMGCYNQHRATIDDMRKRAPVSTTEDQQQLHQLELKAKKITGKAACRLPEKQ